MKRPKFDEFVNFYDKETEGQYAYYYRNLWDACSYADTDYLNHHKKSVWETREYDEWLRSFEKFVKEQIKEEQLMVSVCEKVREWLEVA